MEKLNFYIGILLCYLAISFSTTYLMFMSGIVLGSFLFIKGITKISQTRGMAINYFTHLLFAVILILDVCNVDILEIILIPYIIATTLVLFKKEPKNDVEVALEYKKPFIINGKPKSLFDNIALIIEGSLTSGRAIILPKLDMGYHIALNVDLKDRKFKRLIILWIQLFRRKKYSVLVPFKVNRATIINLVNKGYKIEEAKMTYKKIKALEGKYINCKKELS